MRYCSYKIEGGKMKKKSQGGIDATVYSTSSPLNGKILVNLKLNQNSATTGAKLAVLDYQDGEISFTRQNIVQRRPELYTNTSIGYFGNISDLPRYYEAFNALPSAFYGDNPGQESEHPINRGIVYYYDKANETVVYSSPETFLKYQRFLGDGIIPA